MYGFGGPESLPGRLPDRWHGASAPQSPPLGASDDWPPGRLFPELIAWRKVLGIIGVDASTAERIAARARVQATPFESELLASRLVSETRLYEAIALVLRVPFASVIDPERLHLRDARCALLLKARRPGPVQVEDGEGGVVWCLAPDGLGLERLTELIAKRPLERRRIWITAPTVLREALLQRARPVLAAQARNGLFERHPHLSARFVANAWQGALFGGLAIIVPVALIEAPVVTLLLAHLVFTLFFLACVWLRFAAIRSPPTVPPPDFTGIDLGKLPVYSVLVALHREAEVVPQLLKALDKLVWPRARLKVKLVCEADDAPTLAAIRAHALPSHVEVLEVPPGQPRTKPKALSFALQVTSGDLLVLYDAEDRPHPMQLMEAWRRFCRGGEDLACLQAPLEVTNRAESSISRLFAFEYCGLFRGLLPWLAARRTVLPLGGTSNHLRTRCLEEVGGWDPYNVTEDADLGLRLVRMGYRTETITLPTLEDGPATFSVWLPQRTRWFKGWLQTWLVHMREPVALWRELGPKSFCVAQILSLGLVLSALVHPLLLATALYVIVHLAIGHAPSLWQSSLLVIDAINIACGYVSFLLLGWQALKRTERKGFWRVVLFTPIYWAMLSMAAWRALWQLWRRPHLWEKTPHGQVEG